MGICFKIINGENGGVNLPVVVDGNRHFQQMMKNRNTKNIFKAETGLIYKCSPK